MLSIVTATVFSHVADPDALGADFFSHVVLTASLQIAAHQVRRAAGKQVCCRPGKAVKLLWPAGNPPLAGGNLAI